MAITKLTIYNDALSQIGGARLSTVDDEVEGQRIITAIYDDCRDEVLSEHMWTFAQKRAELIDMTMPDVDLWVKETAYAVDDTVKYNSVDYNCLVANTSTIFTVDLAAAEWEVKLTWVTATGYAVGDQVYESGLSYTCLTAHTSGTFADDLTSVYWILSEILTMDEDGIKYIYYKPTDIIEISMMSDANAIIKVEGTRILSNISDLKLIYTYQNDTPSLYSAQFRRALATRIAAEICFAITESVSKSESLFEKYTKVVLPKAISNDSTQGTPMDARADAWEYARMSGVGSGITGQTGADTWHPVN